MKYYKLKFLGLERNLPVLPTPSGLMIAGFNPVGDMELLTKSAQNLKEQLDRAKIKCDIILTTELKGLPIAQELARLFGVDYVCLRKDKKCYMENPRQTAGESITSGKTNYYISQTDEEKLKGKSIVFVDDVLSTGSTILSMLDYAKVAGLKIVCSATILKEDAPENEDKIKSGFVCFGLPNFFCGFLPLQV